MEKHFKESHRFCSRNRNSLEKDVICGCFYCLEIFNPEKITEWWDDDNTAVCPHCGIDSIIGESSGLKITENFLGEMHKRWF
ncbi:cytoplasmic protein [Bacillus luti]|uniref:cytoplasmic protein n=1 Tax=Bacillus luti TaxID=2026191 RepID=UPI0008FDA9DD|nr:cytoplasmic protein [Bacillus luti]OJE50579.1 cytoplasmic protein [Bacillus luti]